MNIRCFFTFIFSSDDISENQGIKTGSERLEIEGSVSESDFLTIEDEKRQRHESEQRESHKSEVAQKSSSDFGEFSQFARWKTLDFSPCSHPCAGGIQTRDVFCEQVILSHFNHQKRQN